MKIEYAFETARVRLYLPTGGETWFFVDKKQTVQAFKEQCQSEDPYLKSINLLTHSNGSYTELPNEVSLYDLLTGESPLYAQINDNIHEFPLAQESVTSSQV